MRAKDLFEVDAKILAEVQQRAITLLGGIDEEALLESVAAYSYPVPETDAKNLFIL